MSRIPEASHLGAERWDFLRSELEAGREAVALLTTDLETLVPEVIYDADVQVRATVAGTESDEAALISFSRLWLLVQSGVEVLDVRPPERCIAYQALAVSAVGASVYISLLNDNRGLGLLAFSDAPSTRQPDRTIGDWVVKRVVRSGVEEVNERRRRAERELRKQYGAPREQVLGASGGNEIAKGIKAEVIISKLSANDLLAANVFKFPGGELLWTAPRGAVGDIATSVADALGVEAYGAARPGLPSAIVGRYYDDNIDARDLNNEDERGNLSKVATADRIVSGQGHRRDQHGRLVQDETRPQPRGPMSEFARSWLGADPVADLVVGHGDDERLNIDTPAGMIRLAALLDDADETAVRRRDYLASRIDELTTYAGLTRFEATVMARLEADPDLSQRQLAHELGRDETVVSRAVSRARRKLDNRN